MFSLTRPKPASPYCNTGNPPGGLPTMTFDPLGVEIEKRGEGSGVDSLCERAAHGEARAIGEIYDLHHTAVRAFARRLLGEDFSAEDLVHDVFVNLPKAIRNYQGRSSLRTFLISIAINHSRHHVRAAARRRSALGRLARDPIANGHVTPDAERYELAAALNRALDQLPFDQRIAFILCEVEERTSPEAAVIAAVPEGTLRTRLFHAKKKLRTLLEQEGLR